MGEEDDLEAVIEICENAANQGKINRGVVRKAMLQVGVDEKFMEEICEELTKRHNNIGPTDLFGTKKQDLHGIDLKSLS